MHTRACFEAAAEPLAVDGNMAKASFAVNGAARAHRNAAALDLDRTVRHRLFQDCLAHLLKVLRTLTEKKGVPSREPMRQGVLSALGFARHCPGAGTASCVEAVCLRSVVDLP